MKATVLESEQREMDIIIIDDDETILDVLVEIFSNEPNLRITTESNSKRAMDILTEHSFDIIITDLMMDPGPSGIEILRTAKKFHPDSLVIIITGFASLETTLDAINYGAYDYITKPFQIEEFRLVVRKAAERIVLFETIETLKIRIATLETELQRASEENARLLKYIENLRKPPIKDKSIHGGEPFPSAINVERTVSSYEKTSQHHTHLYESELSRLRYLHDTGKMDQDNYVLAVRKLKESIGVAK